MRAGRGFAHAATDRPAVRLRRRASRAVDWHLMDVRASDAERDATVNRLREATAEGRLTLEELTDRIEAAGNAVMRSDLMPLTSDLPATAAVGMAMQPAGVRGVGDVKRSGPWRVPAENSFRTWFGHIKLDLRQAQISCYGDPHSRPCAVRQRRPPGARGRRGRGAGRHAGGPDQRASQLRDTWGAAHRPHRRDVLRRHQSPPPAAVGEAGAPGQTADGTVRHWSEVPRTLFGHSARRVQGRSLDVIVRPVPRPPLARVSPCDGNRHGVVRGLCGQHPGAARRRSVRRFPGRFSVQRDARGQAACAAV